MRTVIVAIVSLVVGLVIGVSWQARAPVPNSEARKPQLAFDPVWARDDTTIEKQIASVDKKVRFRIVIPKGMLIAEVITPPVEMHDPKDSLAVLYLDYRKANPRVMIPLGWERWGPSGEASFPANLHQSPPDGAVKTGFSFMMGPEQPGKYVLCATVSRVRDEGLEPPDPLRPNVRQYKHIMLQLLRYQ
ncbi:MAG: hypothetical protein HZC36_13045 [Armatimonadetes bacterium]|nr:hypothetical protein [Armatimonadota bacterium]